MQAANFGFLDVHDAKLLRLGALAERYFRDDPSTCLFKLRRFAELLAKLVAAHMPANQQQPTIQQLKKRALALAALPRNRGWFELSQVLDLLHGHRRKQRRAKFQDVIDESALSRRTTYYLLSQPVQPLLYDFRCARSTNRIIQKIWRRAQMRTGCGSTD